MTAIHACDGCSKSPLLFGSRSLIEKIIKKLQNRQNKAALRVYHYFDSFCTFLRMMCSMSFYLFLILDIKYQGEYLHQNSFIFCDQVLRVTVRVIGALAMMSLFLWQARIVVEKYESKLTSFQESLFDSGSLRYPSVTFCTKYIWESWKSSTRTCPWISMISRS